MSRIKEYMKDCFKILKTMVIMFVVFVIGFLCVGLFTALDNSVIRQISVFFIYNFLPVSAFLCGILSYIKTRKIIGPCLMFWLLGESVAHLFFWDVCYLYTYNMKLAYICLGIITMYPIVMAISIIIFLLSCFATKYMLKFREKRRALVGYNIKKGEEPEITSENDTKD